MILPSQRLEFDSKSLLSPEQIPFENSSEEPLFTAHEDWLDTTVNMIHQQFVAKDTNTKRVQPMALVRCSRGGKSRTLMEIGKEFKRKYPDVCVLFVSFSSKTPLSSFEQSDPIDALLRRIALVAIGAEIEMTSDKFNSLYLNRRFSIENFRTWLGESKCLLLMDELNNFNNLSVVHSKNDMNLANFLKWFFLEKANRYFVFSSHIINTANQLSSYMKDSNSGRNVIVLHLPLIPNLKTAQKNLFYSNLTPPEAIFYALIPALILEPHYNYTSTNKRVEAYNKCLNDGLVNEASVLKLLSTFVNGNPDNVMLPLLSLMNSLSLEGKGVIQWIPYHMVDVLYHFASSDCIPAPLRRILHNLVDLFNDFRRQSNQSGVGWQAAFVIVLVIRCLTGLFGDQTILNVSFHHPPTFTFYQPFNLEKVDDLLSKIPDQGPHQNQNQNQNQNLNQNQNQNQIPHIDVYYPKHAKFQTYDVIVVAYVSGGHFGRRMFGYQLKEGDKLPENDPIPDIYSYVIRGSAAKKDSQSGGDWKVPSEDNINQFFGISGRIFTPNVWRDLNVKE
jgi:hypothetical protein